MNTDLFSIHSRQSSWYIKVFKTSLMLIAMGILAIIFALAINFSTKPLANNFFIIIIVFVATFLGLFIGKIYAQKKLKDSLLIVPILLFTITFLMYLFTHPLPTLLFIGTGLIMCGLKAIQKIFTDTMY